jgi:hypothetical protein
MTLPREGRSPSIMRCVCGAPLWLPNLAEQTRQPSRYGVSPARAREVQAELAPLVWRLP